MEKKRDIIRRILARLRSPAVLAVLAIALIIALDSFAVDERITGPLRIAARILIVLAVGWGVYAVGDMFLGRRLRKLNLDVADNLKARQIATRLRVLRRMWAVVIVTLTLAAALTAIPWARQIGVSIFASAGIAGIAIGIAAQPVLSNLIAGLQIAFTQPMRIEDAVVVEGEWGWIEEIGLFHVVIRIWDLRRLVVPLRYFIDTPFQNWTHRSATIIGSIFWSLDYRAPVAAMREELDRILDSTDLWDGQVKVLQVTETTEHTIQLRALASSRTSPEAWDLRCYVREKMIDWLQENAPEALPRMRAEAQISRDAPPDSGPPIHPAAPDEPQRDASLQEPAPQNPAPQG